MNYSNYQIAIFNSATGTENLIVDAVAGSGKTTTIVELTKKLRGDSLFVAFNRHIRDELARRVPPGVEVATLNGFGWKACQRNVRGQIKLEKDKSGLLFKRYSDPQFYWKWKYSAQTIISLFKAHLIYQPTNKDITDISDRYGIDIPNSEEYNDAVLKTFAHGKEDLYTMDFDDQIFMPIYKNWSIPQYDNVIVDEAQDLSPFNQELVIRAGKRIIAVGDTRQAIYGFRGADPDSIPNMVKRLNAKVLPLSICYRCPKKIVALAKEIVPHIEHSESAEEGEVKSIKTEEFRKQAVSDDYVLCRTTAPLVSECLRMIREGKKATVKGRDIGQQIITLIDKIATGPDLAEFHEKLNEYFNDQYGRLSRMNKEMEIQALEDRVDTIKVFIEACDNVPHIKQRINEIFSDTVSGIVFCTVHKSKGLEANRIYILKPEQMPHPMAKQGWQRVQEMNLKYVAITRAMKELIWVRL